MNLSVSFVTLGVICAFSGFTLALPPPDVGPTSRDHFVLSNAMLETLSARLEASRADAAEYLDEVLSLLRAQMVESGYSEITLPDLESKFSKKIGFITFHGSASLKKGWIRGLETITRTGPASLDFDAAGNIVLEAKVGVEDASLRYDMKAEFMGLGPSATVTGRLTKLEAILRLRVNPVDLSVALDRFDVQNTGFLTVNVDGLGSVFDFVVEIIVDLVGNAVKRVVLELLEGRIKDLLNNILQDFLFPPTVVTSMLEVQATIAQQFRTFYYDQC